MLEYKRAKGSPSPRLSNQKSIFKSGFSSGLPNSLLLPNDEPADSGLGERMRLRLSALQGQDPAAEAEADRLSEGVQASTPEEVKSVMERRLGADLSDVRLHSGGIEAQRADNMGANAFTVGRDVYFGSGGFRADTAAHEMVHTVQQGAVDGSVSAFVPIGSVQMQPKKIDQQLLDKTQAFDELIKSEKLNEYHNLNNGITVLNSIAEQYDKNLEEQVNLDKQEPLEKQWESVLQKVIDEAEENRKGFQNIKASDRSNDMSDIILGLLEYQTPNTVTFAKDMQGYHKWLNNEYKEGSEQYDQDSFLRKKDPVFVSASDTKDGVKDAVGSVYLGDEQGQQAARVRLEHNSGPTIDFFDHVSRYILEGNDEKLTQPIKQQMELMDHLNTQWPDLLKQPEKLALLRKMEQSGELREPAEREEPAPISDPDPQEKPPLSDEERQKEELLTQLNELGPEGRPELINTLEELRTAKSLAPDSDLSLIDYTKLNTQDGKGSENSRIVEYMKNDGDPVPHNHTSRGHIKADPQMMTYIKNGKADMIQAVRYSMKLRDELLGEEGKKAQNDIKKYKIRLNRLVADFDKNKDKPMEAKEKKQMEANFIAMYRQLVFAINSNEQKIKPAMNRANNFLYAFMSEHNDLKNIPLNTDDVSLNSNYYKKTPAAQ